jgi:hypothetical protein
VLATEVATAPGPFASVYLDASHDTEDAAKVAELRRRGLRDQLADQGAPEETLAALDAAVSAADPPAGKAGVEQAHVQRVDDPLRYQRSTTAVGLLRSFPAETTPQLRQELGVLAHPRRSRTTQDDHG